MPTDHYTCLERGVEAPLYVSTKQVCICTLTAGSRALQACGWKCKTRAIVCAERRFAARKNRNTTGKTTVLSCCGRCYDCRYTPLRRSPLEDEQPVFARNNQAHQPMRPPGGLMPGAGASMRFMYSWLLRSGSICERRHSGSRSQACAGPTSLNSRACRGISYRCDAQS
jgi:hypothetical protein